MISQNAPGTKVTLSALRDGKSKEFTVKLAAMPGADAEATIGAVRPEKNSEHDGLDGVEVDDLTAEVRRENSIPADVRGVFINAVEETSNAYAAGLRAGNVILEIEKTPVRTAEQAVKLCEDAKGERLLVRVWSNEGGVGASRFLSVDNTKKK
jgi:serine protease Do